MYISARHTPVQSKIWEMIRKLLILYLWKLTRAQLVHGLI